MIYVFLEFLSFFLKQKVVQLPTLLQELVLSIDKLESALTEKNSENKRLMENFNTLKTSNETLKKKVKVQIIF